MNGKVPEIRGNSKREENCRGFEVTDFTSLSNGERVSVFGLFWSSSRSLGVCGSLRSDTIRVIHRQKSPRKQQYSGNFTWTSQSCEQWRIPRQRVRMVGFWFSRRTLRSKFITKAHGIWPRIELILAECEKEPIWILQRGGTPWVPVERKGEWLLRMLVVTFSYFLFNFFYSSN